MTAVDDAPGGGVRHPHLHPRLHTSLCDLVGIEVPIVQTGMGWVAGASLVSATAEAGALGILASASAWTAAFAAAITRPPLCAGLPCQSVTTPPAA